MALAGATCAAPAVVGTSAPGVAGTGSGPVAAAVAVSPHRATIAKLMIPTVAVTEPAGGTALVHLATSVRPGGGPTELLVTDTRHVGGVTWLRVLLPGRPNGAEGWIDSDVAVLRSTPWRIVISTERRTVAVYRLGVAVRSFSAVVGARSSPTPHGLFAVTERIPQADPNGFYGSWILTLTAHSTVYRHYQGGDGRVAIHGRGGASLSNPLGTALSHGCIRLDNSSADWLATVAAPGTPVQVV